MKTETQRLFSEKLSNVAGYCTEISSIQVRKIKTISQINNFDIIQLFSFSDNILDILVSHYHSANNTLHLNMPLAMVFIIFSSNVLPIEIIPSFRSPDISLLIDSSISYLLICRETEYFIWTVFVLTESVFVMITY